MTKILVVEDDISNREMLTRRLEWEGYQVVTAENGAQAIVRAIEEIPDLILMDMGLPVMNGWQATHRIKSTSATRAIPIIALTAFALSSDRDKCLKSGCDDYETKPVDFARLTAKMRALLDKAISADVAVEPLASSGRAGGGDPLRVPRM
jgi:two-component system cell cycle response regulator DivK